MELTMQIIHEFLDILVSMGYPDFYKNETNLNIWW